MHIRRGIVEKKDEREKKRRKDAKEAGIVLERPNGKIKGRSGKSWTKRDAGVGAPSIGRFKNGTLVLSKDDVRGLTSQRGKGGRRGRGKRRT